ncbi:DUF3450 domain-containing protein [Ferrimonas sp. SCSIO 43195]|uniref:DUF3450 domain-containing protein n=1 Tax=Ferrimonas sp. SCSIO 43195 TaxID=2822844 RepID=UPI0020757199|nr:DUF3450 domain-containing protein [Ferrimonas sp. SCSIO 43195]USD38832.1 DUF3450 domain-containing protein [Ferrimonas sp. SCSIO 43195]
MKPIHTLFTLAWLALVASAQAGESLEQARQTQSALQQQGRATQQQVERLADDTLEMRTETERLAQELENLQVYHDHLQALVQDQQRELTDKQAQIDGIDTTRTGLVPLMYQMLTDLELRIADDLPIKVALRQQRLAELRALMSRADVADAEKFRRLLEAYQIELEYGRKVAVYRDSISFNGEGPREVELLHLGRLTLLARNLDGSLYWRWHPQQRRWQVIEDHPLSELEQAYRVAGGQQVPQLMSVPVFVGEEQQ